MDDKKPDELQELKKEVDELKITVKTIDFAMGILLGLVITLCFRVSRIDARMSDMLGFIENLTLAISKILGVG